MQTSPDNRELTTSIRKKNPQQQRFISVKLLPGIIAAIRFINVSVIVLSLFCPISDMFFTFLREKPYYMVLSRFLAKQLAKRGCPSHQAASAYK